MNTRTEVLVRIARDMKAPWAPQATNTVKNRGSRLSKIIWKGSQWAATAYGVEARDGRYQIQRARLWKDDLTWSWVQHMAEKEWVDIDDFTEALRIARVEHSLMDRGVLGRRNKSLGVLQHGKAHYHSPGVQMRLGICRGAGDDAVEIIRKARGFDKRLSAAC